MTVRFIGCFIAHGWHKVMPRPRHPKSDLETQEQFKKLSTLVEAAVASAGRREAGDECPVLILAQDEGCFGRISQVKRA